MSNTRKAILIEKIISDQDLFDRFKREFWRGTVTEYLDEYSYIPDIAERLASDLGIDLD